MQVIKCEGEGQGSCKRCNDMANGTERGCAFFTELRDCRVAIVETV